MVHGEALSVCHVRTWVPAETASMVRLNTSRWKAWICPWKSSKTLLRKCDTEWFGGLWEYEVRSNLVLSNRKEVTVQ